MCFGSWGLVKLKALSYLSVELCNACLGWFDETVLYHVHVENWCCSFRLQGRNTANVYRTPCMWSTMATKCKTVGYRSQFNELTYAHGPPPAQQLYRRLLSPPSFRFHSLVPDFLVHMFYTLIGWNRAITSLVTPLRIRQWCCCTTEHVRVLPYWAGPMDVLVQ